jgi:hypothetical protein
MGTVPASAVWTIAAKSPGESLWNLVKNQRFRVEKALNKKSSCSVASDVQATQSPRPTELLMHCPQVKRGHQVQAL